MDTYIRNIINYKYTHMKTKPGFRLSEVCGSYMLIAEGEENLDFCDLISMNESSKLLWDSVQGRDFTDQDLAQILMDNYQIDDDTPLPPHQALEDARSIMQKWKEAGIAE